MSGETWTSQGVIDALRTHYGDAYRLVEQVADRAGWHASRWLDVMAFGLWPSRGLEIHGIEVKVSKSDLRRELKNPEKAEATAARCDRFFVAGPASVFDLDEMALVAPSWGVLAVSRARGSTKVAVLRKAEKIEAKPVDREFIASIFRRIKPVSDDLRDELRREVEANFEERVAGAVEHRSKMERFALETLQERIAAFEAGAGVPIGDLGRAGWYGMTPAEVGKAVRMIAEQLGRMRDGWSAPDVQIQRTADQIENRAKILADLAESIRKIDVSAVVAKAREDVNEGVPS